MAKLYIENLEVELGDQRLVFNKKGEYANNWLAKNVTYSERIRLPESGTLNFLFQRPQAPSIIADKFTSRSFKYIEAGTTMFSGDCHLLEFSEVSGYELQLVDKAMLLFKQLDNLLHDIDFEASDFIFNTVAYDNLKLLNSSVWLWAADSRHENKSYDNTVLSGNLAFSRPFFSVKRIVEEVLDSNKWSYSLSDASAFFDELIFSHEGAFLFTSYEKTFNEVLVVNGLEQLNLLGYSFIKTDNIAGTNTLRLNFDSRIRLRGMIISDVDLEFDVIGSTNSGDELRQKFLISKGANNIDFTSEVYKTVNPAYNLTFQFIGTANVELKDFLMYTIIDENKFGDVDIAGFVDFKVKTYDNLPKLTQSQILKHCLVSVAGFFNTDKYRRKLNINSLLQVNKLGALDWSNKFIENTLVAKPVVNYGRKNYYNYKDSDVKADAVGRGEFFIESIDNKTIVSIYESVFEASPEAIINGITMLYNDTYNDTERINNFNSLLGYIVVDGTHTVARFDKLNGNRLLTNFFKNFISALKKGKLYDGRFLLNKTDFLSFDFTKPIYIKHLKSVFFVLDLGEYIEYRESTLILLKM